MSSATDGFGPFCGALGCTDDADVVIYRRHTDIRSDSTLKKRIRALVGGPDFRIAGAGDILYDPAGDSDE